MYYNKYASTCYARHGWLGNPGMLEMPKSWVLLKISGWNAARPRREKFYSHDPRLTNYIA